MRKSLFVGGWMMILIPGLVMAQTAASKDTQAESSKSAPAASYKSFKEAYAAGNDALKARHLVEAAQAYEAAETMASSGKGKSQMANAQGWALLQDKKLEDAKKAFARAVEENGENKVALKNLGVVEYRMYQYGLADSSVLKEVVKNLEASGENQELLDRAKGDQSREESYAQVTPEATPDLSKLKFKELCAYGDKLQAQGQFKEAMKVFKMAEDSAASPDAKSSAANRQGKLLLDTHRPSEATSYFEKAVDYKPSDKQLKVFLNSLGLSYWGVYDSGKGKGGELNKAVEAFYKMNSIDASYHHDNLEMALDELKAVDPEAAKAYTVKDDTTADDKGSNGKSEKAKDDDKEATK